MKSTDLWIGKGRVPQVTHSTERTVELWALMSAPDAPTAWSLRCEVREKLIGFIQKDYPVGPSEVRAEMGESAIVASAMHNQKVNSKVAEDKRIFIPNSTLFTSAISVMGVKS